VVPVVAIEAVVPHCNNNPFGNLVYPLVAWLEEPKVNELLEFTRFVEVIVVTTTFAKVVLPAKEAPVATVFNVVKPVTFNVFATLVGTVVLTFDAFAVKTVVDVFPNILTSVKPEITIDGPEVLPVCNDSGVVPFAVLIKVVVKLDIIL